MRRTKKAMTVDDVKCIGRHMGLVIKNLHDLGEALKPYMDTPRWRNLKVLGKSITRLSLDTENVVGEYAPLSLSEYIREVERSGAGVISFGP